MYFQQIYRFEVDMLKKFSMSLPQEQSIQGKFQQVDMSLDGEPHQMQP